jgi:dTDP-4-dehydrorhamnose reductase
MRVLVLGSNGSLGGRLCEELKRNSIKFFPQTRSINNKYYCTFENHEKFIKLINQTKPNIVINTISNVNLLECEKNYFKCFEDNILTSYIISKILKKKKIKQIYISTDQVYSGKGPHKEKKIDPLNNYAISKAFSEKFVIESGGTVLRVNFIHKSLKKKTFHDQVIFTKKKVTLFKNLYFSPLYIDTLCKIIIQNLNKFNSEIYNLGSSDKISKKDFIQNLCKIINIKRNFNISNYNSKIIKRPLDMSMNSNKINKYLKLKKYSVINEIYKLSREYK